MSLLRDVWVSARRLHAQGCKYLKAHSFSYLAVDAGCRLGLWLEQLAETLVCGLSTWLAWLPHRVVAGFLGKGERERKERIRQMPYFLFLISPQNSIISITLYWSEQKQSHSGSSGGETDSISSHLFFFFLSDCAGSSLQHVASLAVAGGL